MRGFDVAALPAEFREAMKEPFERAAEGKNPARTSELVTLAAFADSDESTLDNGFFPMPDGYDPGTWNELKSRILVLVNLLSASVRTLRTHVYGGKVSRRIIKNPYKPELETYVAGWHPALMREWFSNRATFSNAPAVPLVTKIAPNRYKMRTWLLNPVYTYLVGNPHNMRECWGVAEFSPNGERVQFMTRWGHGVLEKNKPAVQIAAGDSIPEGATSYFVAADFGFLPAVVAHAERRSSGGLYSQPPFKNAPKFTVRASDTLFNGGLLQKLQTKGLLVLAGLKPEDFENLPAAMREGFLSLTDGGRAQWIVPESRIADTLELLDRLIEVYSVTSAIPVDELNPTSSKGTSAEEAARRSAPLRNMAAEYAEAAELDEADLVLRATALRRWAETGQKIDLDVFADEVETEVRISSRLRPRESQSDAQILQIGYELGAILPEDAAEAWNPGAGEDKLARVVASMEERREAAAPAITQQQEAVNEAPVEPGEAIPPGQ